MKIIVHGIRVPLIPFRSISFQKSRVTTLLPSSGFLNKIKYDSRRLVFELNHTNLFVGLCLPLCDQLFAMGSSTLTWRIHHGRPGSRTAWSATAQMTIRLWLALAFAFVFCACACACACVLLRAQLVLSSIVFSPCLTGYISVVAFSSHH